MRAGYAMMWTGALFCGCGSSEAGGDAQPPAPPAAASGGVEGWAQDEVASIRARYRSNGAATQGTELTGTFIVGPTAARLDLDHYPNAGYGVSFVRVHGEGDLWKIDPVEKTYDRALSGDWTHHLLPRVVDQRRLEAIAAGECPFGRANPEDCVLTGDAEVAGEKVQIWQHRNRSIAIAPALRVGLREEYTPFFKKPDTQLVELSELVKGPQDAALFKMPEGFACKAEAFCDDAPR